MLKPQLTPTPRLRIDLAIAIGTNPESVSKPGCVEKKVKEILRSLKASEIDFSTDIINIDPTELDWLENKSYDLILLLWNKENKSRAKLGEWLEKVTKQKNIPIIIIEESSSEERLREYQKLGITEMISKDKVRCLPEIIASSLVKKEFNRQKEPEIAHLVRKEKNRERLLYEIVKKINSSLNPEKILEDISQTVGETLNLERIIICSKTKAEIKIVKQWRSNREIEQIEPEKITITVGEVVTAAEIATIHEKIAEAIGFEAPRYLQSIPIFQRDEYRGSLILNKIDKHKMFLAEEIQTLETIAELIAIVLERMTISETIAQIAAEKEAALATDRLKSEVIAHISHEFRNPLTAIMGFARMLGEEIYGSLNNKQMQYVSAISSSGKHLLELINDILDLSKIEADREEIYLEPVPIEEVCLASMSMVQELAAQKGLELKLIVEPSVSFCLADRRRLKQILVNLLSNAVKFTETGGVTLQIKENSTAIEFNVIDTGIGIDPVNSQKIFEPFTQIKSHLSKKYKGTGLGLPLSAKLAKLHGGNLSLTSERGKGSCFTLSLPKH